MAKEKKGAKFGRHDRNPSSKLQKQRTEKNRRIAREKAAKAGDPNAGVAANYGYPHAFDKTLKDQRTWHLIRQNCRNALKAAYPCSAVRKGAA